MRIWNMNRDHIMTTRILLLSDTHGNIDIINTLVEKTNTDMVIHAGDFGFYNESKSCTTGKAGSLN